MQIWELEAFALLPVCPLCFLFADVPQRAAHSPSSLGLGAVLPRSGTVSHTICCLGYATPSQQRTNLRWTPMCRSSTAPMWSFARRLVGKPVDWQGWESIRPPYKASFRSQSSILALVPFLPSQANPSAAKLSVISKRNLSEGICGVFASFRVLDARSHLDSRRVASPRGLLPPRSSWSLLATAPCSLFALTQFTLETAGLWWASRFRLKAAWWLPSFFLDS